MRVVSNRKDVGQRESRKWPGQSPFRDSLACEQAPRASNERHEQLSLLFRLRAGTCRQDGTLHKPAYVTPDTAPRHPTPTSNGLAPVAGRVTETRTGASGFGAHLPARVRNRPRGESRVHTDWLVRGDRVATWGGPERQPRDAELQWTDTWSVTGSASQQDRVAPHTKAAMSSMRGAQREEVSTTLVGTSREMDTKDSSEGQGVREGGFPRAGTSAHDDKCGRVHSVFSHASTTTEPFGQSSVTRAGASRPGKGDAERTCWMNPGSGSGAGASRIRGGIGPRVDAYLTAPAVTPRVRVRWKMRKKTTMGMTPRSAAALRAVGSLVYWPCMTDRPRGTVWLSLEISRTRG